MMNIRQYIERIERLLEEKKCLSEDIKEIYSEAKSIGFDPKIMRQVIKMRKMSENERDEIDLLVQTYMSAMNATNEK